MNFQVAAPLSHEKILKALKDLLIGKAPSKNGLLAYHSLIVKNTVGNTVILPTFSTKQYT